MAYPVITKLVGANGTKGILMRSGVLGSMGATVMETTRVLAEMWVQDPKLQTTIVLLMTTFVSCILAAVGNPSRRV